MAFEHALIFINKGMVAIVTARECQEYWQVYLIIRLAYLKEKIEREETQFQS